MKTKNIKIFILLLVSVVLIKCDYHVSDFGFNGTIKGTVKDNNGDPLHGDLSSNNLLVKLLGEGDEQAIEIRVNGEGTYQNIKMFPKKHKVWVEGPIVKSDTVNVDFSIDEIIVQDFTVTPLLDPHITGGTANGTSVSVDYSIDENAGNVINKMEIYVSTVQYPTAATGSRENVYFTKTVELSQPSGTVVADGLESGVTYYIRIGAQASSSALMNYSNQIEITIP